MCLTSADERLELNRKFKSLSKKQKFKVIVELIINENRINKTVSTPDGYFDFCIENNVHIDPKYIFDTFYSALTAFDRTIYTHHFVKT